MVDAQVGTAETASVVKLQSVGVVDIGGKLNTSVAVLLGDSAHSVDKTAADTHHAVLLFHDQIFDLTDITAFGARDQPLHCHHPDDGPFVFRDKHLRPITVVKLGDSGELLLVIDLEIRFDRKEQTDKFRHCGKVFFTGRFKRDACFHVDVADLRVEDSDHFFSLPAERVSGDIERPQPRQVCHRVRQFRDVVAVDIQLGQLLVLPYGFGDRRNSIGREA